MEGHKTNNLKKIYIFLHVSDFPFFTRKSSYCFQRVLATAILSVRLSVTRVHQSKNGAS